jgi:quercetin dioxygenase-like cupin family protein
VIRDEFFRKRTLLMGAIHKQSLGADSPIWSYPTVPLSDYSTEASAGITKQVLVGMTEGAVDFIVRYFTIPPGGKSAYDRHRHQHGVVITHGTGRVLLGEKWHDLGVGDAVFIDADEIHQLEATGAAQLGFICVIPRWAESDSCAVSRR